MQTVRQYGIGLALICRILIKVSKMTKVLILFLVIFSSTFAVYTYTRAASAPKAYAATSSTLNFQGRLLSSSGGIVPDGTYNLEFKLYDAELNGSGANLWTESYTGGSKVRVVNGYFSVSLGSQTAFPGTINWDQELWLTMNVGGSGAPVWDGEMLAPGSKRTKLTAVPYAFKAGSAKQLLDTQGSFTGALSFLPLTNNRTINLPDASGTVLLDSTGFANGGNSFSSGTATLGTNDLNDLVFETNNVEGLRLDQAGNVSIGTGADGLEKLEVNGGIKIGNSVGTNAGTLRWTGVDFEGYDGTSWVSLTAGGGTTIVGTTGASFTSFAQNLPGTATATATGIVTLTTTTAVSSVAGSNTFVAPVDGSFRSCTVITNANRTAGSATLRWRVNGVSVGAGACVIDGTNIRTSSSALASGVVSFNAGDVITVAIDSSGFTPTNTDFTVYWSVEYETAGGSGIEFVQGGNSFGATAVLGTSDANGLNIITNGGTRLSFNTAGDATFSNITTFNSSATINSGLAVSGGINVSSGGVSVTGNSTIAGTLSGLSGLSLASGNLDINGGAINNANSLSSSTGLTLSSGGSGDIILNSASGSVVLGANTISRAASGTTTIDLNDVSDTTLSLSNSGAGLANLAVDGAVTATGFNGSGAGLTSLNASNVTTGLLDDARLSSNVALLNGGQTFTALTTFNSGLVLGNTASSTAGALRWTGVDFEGYNGSSWVSLTSGGGAGSNVTTVIKPGDETINNINTLQDDDDLVFPVGANEVWSFRFAVQATANAAADFRFAVIAPSGAVCQVGFAVSENAASDAQKGCGATSTVMNASGTAEFYEISGTVTNGTNAGDVRLQWAQFTAGATNAVVHGGSYVTAFPESIYIAPPSTVYSQGGNSFGGLAIIGTTDTNGLNIVTDGSTRLSFTAGGDATFSGGVTLSSSVTANAGLSVSGGSVSVNSNSNNDTLINTGSSTGTVSIGGGASVFSLDSTAFDVSSGGALSGISTLVASGAISGATSTDTINGLVINTGALSNITGYTQTSGNFSQSGTGTFSTGTGDVSLNSATTVSNSTTNPGVTITQTGDGSGLRINNNAITSGALVDITHTTSGFTGTGLKLNIASGSGSFASGNFLDFQINGTSKLKVDNNGGLAITTTTTSGLNVSDNGGLSVLNVDTSGKIVNVGSSTSDTNAILLVLDSASGSDPVGVAGAQYYNSTSNKFRCFENGEWKNCLGYTSVRSFIDTTSDVVVDANTTNYWDLAAENNNATPNIVLSQPSGRSVMGMVTMEMTSTSNADIEVTARVERGIGAPPTCGSGTPVGGSVGVFSTNNGGVKASTVTFVDNPNTTSVVYYVLCSDSATVGTSGNVTRIRVTLQEVSNSN